MNQPANPAELIEDPREAADSATAAERLKRPPEATPSGQSLAPIIGAVHAVMQAVEYITKTGKNQGAGWAYASEADVLGPIRRAMVEHGLVLFPNVVKMEHEPYTTRNNQGTRVFVTVEHTLAHTSGVIWPEKIRAVGCAEDTQDKAAAQAGTSAQKYCLLRLFLVETGQDSDKGRSERPAPNGQDQADDHGQNSAPPPQDASFEDWAKRTMAEAEEQGVLDGWREYHRDSMKANVASGAITQEQYDWARRLFFAKTRKEDQSQGG